VKAERVKKLLTMPQIGPVTVEAYLGLVPREWSASEVQRRGRITQAGNRRMRWLLVAWRVATHEAEDGVDPRSSGSPRKRERAERRIELDVSTPLRYV
jgi:transposase